MTPQLPPREILSNPPPGLKYISICSGIEAATMAFHPLGWTPLAFAEIETFPSAVLAHHYPNVPNLGDITNFREWPEELLAECDLLVGGPPCQAFSIAGLRNSLEDDRGNLTLTYVKLIDHIDSIRRKHGRDPIIALYENVPGIYSTRDNAFGCLVGAICGQNAPVETETGKWPTAGVFWGEKRRVGYRTLDAQYFGLAQRRRRCFLLAVPNQLVERFGNRADPAEILSIPESLRGDSPPSRQAGEKPAPTISARTKGGGGLGTEDDLDGGLIAAALTARYQKGVDSDCTQTLVAHALRAEGFDASEDGTGRGTPIVPVQPYTLAVRGSDAESRFEFRQDGLANAVLTPNGGRAGIGGGAVAYRTNAAGQVDAQGDCTAALTTMTDPATQFIAFSCKDHGADASDIAPTLRAMGHDGSHANAGGQLAVAFAENQRAEVLEKDVVDGLKMGGGKPGQGYPAIRNGMQVRRLTPRECEKLMGFPDDFTLIPFRGKPAADGPRYKALGNSMAVPCMRWIGERIQMIEEQRRQLALAA